MFSPQNTGDHAGTQVLWLGGVVWCISFLVLGWLMLVGCLRGCGTPDGVVGFDPRRDVTRPVCRAAANTLCWVVGRVGDWFLLVDP